MLNIYLIEKKILIPYGNARDVAVKFYITHIITSSIVFKPISIFAVDINCYLDLIPTNYIR